MTRARRASLITIEFLRYLFILDLIRWETFDKAYNLAEDRLYKYLRGK
jgi:hypothetical protein